MSIKSILVHLDNTEACDIRLRNANMLADYFDAALSGLHVDISSSILNSSMQASGGILAASIPGSVYAVETASLQAKQHIEKKLQNMMMHDSDPALMPWRTVNGLLREALPYSCRYHDLAIVSDNLDSHDLLGTLTNPAIDIAVAAGCPVLALPSTKLCTMPLKHPLIVWDASAESSRALSDALPFLTTADALTVYNINQQTTYHVESEHAETDILRYLHLHGIKANFVTQKPDSEDSAGDALLNRLIEQRHDLVITGAYSHSRLRELLLGSLTRELLSNASIPILLSN